MTLVCFLSAEAGVPLLFFARLKVFLESRRFGGRSFFWPTSRCGLVPLLRLTSRSTFGGDDPGDRPSVPRSCSRVDLGVPVPCRDPSVPPRGVLTRPSPCPPLPLQKTSCKFSIKIYLFLKIISSFDLN